jgi:hypothetical protein
MRVINLKTCNAGQDDGVPTSLLRELALVQALTHQNISNIHKCEVYK